MRFLMNMGIVLSMLLAPIGVMSAKADDSNRDWNQSEGWQSPSANANSFNAAYDLYLAQHGLAGNVTNNTTNCDVAAACQNGGTATNLSGVSVTTVNGSGNSVSTGIKATSNQTASAISLPSSDIGTINLSY